MKSELVNLKSRIQVIVLSQNGVEGGVKFSDIFFQTAKSGTHRFLRSDAQPILRSVAVDPPKQPKLADRKLWASAFQLQRQPRRDQCYPIAYRGDTLIEPPLLVGEQA